jgi:MFS family permease
LALGARHDLAAQLARRKEALMDGETGELDRDFKGVGEAAAIVAAPEPKAVLAVFKRSTFSVTRFRLTAACLIGSMFGSSFLAITAIGLIMAPLTQTFHWNRAEISGAVTLLLLLGAVMTAIWGRLIDRFGAKWIAILGALGAGYLAFTTAALVPFYLGFAALGVCGAAAVGYTKMVGLLFTENRGKALATFGMEASIVGAFAPQLLLRLQNVFGWRGMFIAMAVCIVIAAGVMTLLLWGLDTQAPPPTASAPVKSDAANMGDNARQVRKSPAFWLINLATMSGNLTFTGLLPHMVPLAMSRGMSVQAAVTALSLQTLFMPIGQFAGGFVLDRAPSARVAATPFALVALAGVLTIAFAPHNAAGTLWLWAGVAVLGFGNGAKRSMNSYFFTRYFGMKTLAETTGLSLAATAVVLAPAPLLFGFIFDGTKSYDMVLTTIIGGLVIATLCYGLLGPYRFSVDARTRLDGAKTSAGPS